MTDTTITKHKRRTAREPMATQAGTKDNAVAQAEKGKENTGPNPLKPSKIDEVLQLLKRTGGATLDELVEATNWLPHTARAAMTGLKRKGHTIERTKVDGVSRYTVVEPGTQ